MMNNNHPDLQFPPDVIQSAISQCQASPKIRKKAATVLAQMKAQELTDYETPEGAIAGLINDYDHQQMVVVTYLGHHRVIPIEQWTSVLLD